jgi:hypothetical protein
MSFPTTGKGVEKHHSAAGCRMGLFVGRSSVPWNSDNRGPVGVPEFCEPHYRGEKAGRGTR